MHIPVKRQVYQALPVHQASPAQKQNMTSTRLKAYAHALLYKAHEAVNMMWIIRHLCYCP